MKLTIITPVYRLEYLYAIAQTIPKEVRWLCSFYNNIPKNLPSNAECIALPEVKSDWGVAKINYALQFVTDGHVYILDDDTIVHPDFPTLLNVNSMFDFIHFNQDWKNGKKRIGGAVEPYEIDIGSFIASRKLIGDTYLKDGRTPDGTWAKALYNKAEKVMYINKAFSFYNYLR